MKHCKQEMREVGRTGRFNEVMEMNEDGSIGKVIGRQDEKIYQCGVCMRIEIDYE